MTMISWDPVRDLVSLRSAVDRLMEESVVPSWAGRGRERDGRALRLPVDVYVTENELVIKASVPGLKGDEVEITLEGDNLSIKGEFPAPLENVEYLINERPYGSFGCTLTINIPVDVDGAEAKFENGVLTLILPKAEEARPRVIKVATK
ncbi:MAG TPA: Hsp20/alpha crystallin family protein [Thermoflexia bacterium]|nr:Hsp20/alpha crystallin family protein [Thermoflexia bacterium]